MGGKEIMNQHSSPEKGMPEDPCCSADEFSEKSWGGFLLDQQDVWNMETPPLAAEERQPEPCPPTEDAEVTADPQRVRQRLPLIRAAADPLSEAARPLLRALAELPESIDDRQHVERLKQILKREISQFTMICDELHIPWKKMAIVRYCLCTALDEAAHSMDWGISSGWSQSNLLNHFENDNDGGNKFFLLAGRISMNPAEYSDVISILLRILNLGFEGRYSIVTEGERQLIIIRQRLLALVHNAGNTPPLPALMGDIPDSPRPAGRRYLIPWQLTAMMLLVLILSGWLVGKYSLSGREQSLTDAMYTLQNYRYPPVFLAARLSLAELLRPEILSHLLTVNDDPRQSHVTLHGDRTFRSGSAVLTSEMVDVLEKIAVQILRVKGDVLIVGHTDAVPVRYSGFTDNQKLSVLRATAVARYFQQAGIPAAKITVRGMSDQQPVSTNSTAAGRASNRRVEFFVTY